MKFLKICIIIIFLATTSYAYKDVGPKTKEAITDFEQRGMMGEFMGKYGKDYFRPTSTITRQDLLLTLQEYDRFVQTVMTHQKNMYKKFTALERTLNRKMANFTRQAVKLSADEVLKKVKQEMPSLYQGGSVPPGLKEDLANIKNRLNLLESSFLSGGGGSFGSGTSSYREGGVDELTILSELRRTIPAMIEDSLKKSPVVKKTIRKEVRKAAGSSGRGPSGEEASGGRVAVLTKLSIGFTMLALLLMAR